MKESKPPAKMTVSYTGPSARASFSGYLFDMDGTVIDSTEAVEKHWHSVGKEIGVDPEFILKTSHGMRSIDTLKVVAPEKANWEYVIKMEALLPKLYGQNVHEIPGAHTLLEDLSKRVAPWTIVTSGTKPLVGGWLQRLGLPKPEHLITAESVPNGKPDPACYLMGLKAVAPPGVPASSILVLEDSPAGIKAGKDAGCKVLAVVTSHTAEQVAAAEPDWIVKDLRSVRVVDDDGKGITTLEFSDTLVLTGGDS